MDKLISKMLSEFEGGKITRRQLIQSIAVAATVYGAGAEVASAAPTTLGLKTISVNHISYGAPDYTKARDFYVKLLGTDYPADMDTGGQACLPFGPKVAQTFLLPRGGRDANAAPAAPRGAGGGGGGGGRGADPNDPCAAVIAAERGARGGGRGAGAPADAAAGGAAGAGRGGAGGGAAQAPRPVITATIDQLGFLVANWDAKKVEAALKNFGLDPKADGESFHITDPYGLDVMISGPKAGAY